MVKVAIIDENERKQLELRKFINDQQELTCSWSGGSVAELQRTIITNGTLDIVIICLNEEAVKKLPPSQLRRIKASHPETEILILADCADTKKVITWLRAGIVGYLPRNTKYEEI